MTEHKHTDECGFDRNGSLSEDTYVCMCGWREERALPPPGGETDKRTALTIAEGSMDGALEGQEQEFETAVQEAVVVALAQLGDKIYDLDWANKAAVVARNQLKQAA